MSGTHRGVRLRQAVIVADELEPVAGSLRDALGLGEPFRDPGVGIFGLVNTVFALDDCFLEVISPTRAGTAAGRYMERNGGDGGYMVIFDIDDLTAARARAAELGVRAVWEVDLPDISATHLHPADMQGAIVSIDHPEPRGTWRWGGPEWTGRTGAGAELRLAGATIAVQDAAGVAARWGRVLGLEPGGDGSVLGLDGAELRFVAPGTDGREGLVELDLALPAGSARAPERLELGGISLRLEPAR
jgi:hypothetical protein